MIRVMLVDDEEHVLRGMMNIISWESEGFEIVGKASGYEEALKLFEKEKPNVVITDIVMSDGNGIDLLKEIKSINNETNVIILTGYADFDYIKSAMDNDTNAFLLKPLSSFELMRALRKIKMKHNERTKLNEQNFLGKLVSCNMDIDKIYDYAEFCGIQLTPEYFMVVAQLDNCNEEERAHNYEKLGTFFEEMLYERYSNIVYRMDNKRVVILLFDVNSYEMDNICKFLSMSKMNFTRKYGISVSLGISCLYKDLKNSLDAYIQAGFALSQKALKGYGETIYYNPKSKGFKDDPWSVSIFFSVEELNIIITGLKKNNKDIVFDIINGFFKKIKNSHYVNMDFLRSNLKDVVLQLLHIFHPIAELQTKYFGSIINPIVDIENIELIEDLKAYLENVLLMILDKGNKNIEPISSIVQDIYSFVALNYQTAIRIEDVADALHVDKNILMKSFKNETGQTIGEYITEYRIELAKSLIKSGKFYINEVSYYVGYRDTKYFSKVFRKIVGCSPKEYQQQVEN